MSDVTELLPCPFCGDPMVNDMGLLRHQASRDCPIAIQAWDEDGIAAWNRRAPAAPSTPARDDLRAVSDALNGWCNVLRDGREPALSISGLRDMAKVVREAAQAEATPARDDLRASLLRWCDERQDEVMGCLDLRAEEETAALLWIGHFRAALRDAGGTDGN